MRKNTEKVLKAALQAAEAELAAATKLSAVNAAARKLMRAKEELKRFQGESAKPASRRAVTRGARAAPLPERLTGFVQLKARLLEVPYNAIGELAPGHRRGRVLAQDPGAAGSDYELGRSRSRTPGDRGTTMGACGRVPALFS